MDILNIFKRKKKREFDTLDEPLRPRDRVMQPDIRSNIESSLSLSPNEMRSQIDLLSSQMQSMRLQYDAINARLQNIERIVIEIRSFCK